MSESIIQVQNLSKLYHLGGKKAGNFRETVSSLLTSPFKSANANKQEFWALRDVSFDIKQGELVAFIGRNGAGKSTLLKVLSRITHPTSGRIEIKGRVGSLLEVGTGFHPELSGRENIFLNGAILGMTRQEIKRKFDEIVDFSGVEKFIDTPVKHYSSGMYVRLAFAVAAHLEPEILIIDEVLAVGDIAFQKKCLGKMNDVATHGRTVLFVSHNMQAVRALCNRGIMLKYGSVAFDGEVGEAINQFEIMLRDQEFDENADLANRKNRRGSGEARFKDFNITKVGQTESCYDYEYGEEIQFDFTIVVQKTLERLWFQLIFKSGMTGEAVFNYKEELKFGKFTVGQEYRFRFTVRNPRIRPGVYPLMFKLVDYDTMGVDVLDDVSLPLRVSSELSYDQLGFDPSNFSGYWTPAGDLELQ